MNSVRNKSSGYGLDPSSLEENPVADFVNTVMECEISSSHGG
jgi:hypothetical protein